MAKVGGLLKSYHKEYKKEVGVMGVRDDDPPRLLTGMFPLDLSIGGGIPEGRMTLIYGFESAMKTSIALKVLAAAQRKYPDRTPAFIDVEGHLDRKWARKLGVDVDRIAHLIPQNAEQAVDMAESLLFAEDISCIVFDSLAALQVQTELEKSSEDSSPGKQALVINRFYRKATHALNDARVEGGFAPTLVLINQIRFKIGAGKFEDPETMPGGPAFKFASSMTLRLYGKDVMPTAKMDVKNKNKAAYKQISAIVRKHKVPIASRSCKLMVALQDDAESGVLTGEVYCWNTVNQYLQNMELFVKGAKGGWDLIHPTTGEVEHFPTQDALKLKLKAHPAYADTLYAGLIRVVMENEGVLDVEQVKE